MFDLFIAQPIRWLKLHYIIQQVERLDQHLLDDIGIPRRHIADCVSGRRPTSRDLPN